MTCLTTKSGKPISYTPEHSLMVLLMAYCGLRIGEVIALRAGAIDVDARLLHVVTSLNETPTGSVIGAPKHGIFRDVPIPGGLVRKLSTLIADMEDGDYIFTGPHGGMINRSRWFNRVWKVARGIAGLDQEVTPYSLRHFFAANAVRKGSDEKNLQELMGFASVKNLKVTYRDLFPKGRSRKYCSDRCMKKAGRDSQSAVCSADGCDRPRRAKELCGTHYNASFFKGDQRKYDTPEKKRARDQRRRAVVFDHDADLISRDRVGDRDGWVCGICRRDVDISLSWPDPNSPSLDHVVPLARGGRHTYSNVRISHLTCNVKRGCPVEV